jgi:hypothetical protein
MTALAFLGPEFIFQLALGQLVSARRSVKEFHASGHTSWSMTHAFYADMGGFILDVSDSTPFPIDAKQLHYLVMEDWVDFPKITREEIADKNKVNGLLRILTLCQIIWFMINMAGRRAQNLAVTCGELTTAAFIVCSIGSTLCWLRKPCDVATPEIIKTKNDATISDILLKAGEHAGDPYGRTPLEFLSRKEWPWSLYWSNWINILRNIGIEFSPLSRPVERFENTVFLELPGAMNYVFFGMTAIYTSIFVCGWNYSFPTRIETILWHAASATMMGTLVTYWAITEFGFSLYPFLRQRFEKKKTPALFSNAPPPPEKTKKANWFMSKARAAAACVRNNSVFQDPSLTVPLKAILPIYIVGVFYCHARAYIFIADILSLPASAYSTVDWIQLIPHF